MHPIIGITCSTAISSMKEQCEHCVVREQEMVFRKYIQAVVAGGGAPFMVPLVRDESVIESLAAKLDGLLLTGGVDVNPRYYHSEPHPKLGLIDPDKDRLELRLTKLAFQAGIPILGICRGIQIVNVAGGGTLYQDIPSEITPPVLKHVQQAPMDTLTHSVTLKNGTVLHKILQQDQINVNSHHHQAVKDIATGFQVTAVSPDGVVEGIEHTSKTFIVGVQWHPEGSYQKDVNSQRLFRAFIEAALLKM